MKLRLRRVDGSHTQQHAPLAAEAVLFCTLACRPHHARCGGTAVLNEPPPPSSLLLLPPPPPPLPPPLVTDPCFFSIFCLECRGETYSLGIFWYISPVGNFVIIFTAVVSYLACILVCLWSQSSISCRQPPCFWRESSLIPGREKMIRRLCCCRCRCRAVFCFSGF